MVASAGGVEVGDVVEDVEAVFGGGGDVAADSGEAEAFLALRSYLSTAGPEMMCGTVLDGVGDDRVNARVPGASRW